MNTQKIAKLEALLDRVKARAAVSHAGLVSAAAPPAATAVAPLLLVEADVAEDATQFSTPSFAKGVDFAMEASDAEIEEMLDADIEISTEPVEIDVDEDESVAPESSAQIVLEALDEFAVAEALSQSQLPVEEESAASLQTTSQFANELETEPPVSSRRPVESAAEEEGSAPRHTPPPESGKQVAAPQVVARPGAPAAAVGTWPGVPDGHVPERVSPALPASAGVAKMEAFAFKPANFGDLLDATLSL